MPSLRQLRSLKPAYYPNQAIYAEYAALSFGLAFDIRERDGLAFDVASQTRQIVFGGGRGSYFPQNNATSATLAADKYLSAIVMDAVGVPTLGGAYFFLDERYRAHRAPGHERADAVACFHALGSKAFVKPLTGSRGDFAQAICDEAALRNYLDDIARHYDSIIMQEIFEGDEYRVVVLDDAVLYSARKRPPFLVGDGTSTVRDLLRARDALLAAHGISSIGSQDNLDVVLPLGERWILPGRMNRSVGGDMLFADPPARAAELAIKAVQALGLRAAGVDLFTELEGGKPIRVIEINANPSIRFLEDSGREDLILAIWRHTFKAMGLLDV
jgi:hypothetical protein